MIMASKAFPSNKYNNLSKEDLIAFSKFSLIYAKKIKKITTLSDFKREYPDATSLFRKKIQAKIMQASAKIIKASQSFSKKTLIFTGNKADILEFCRHFRNSFAHGLLEKEKKNLSISDSYRGNKTCTGSLPYNTVKKFIDEIIRVYEK